MGSSKAAIHPALVDDGNGPCPDRPGFRESCQEQNRYNREKYSGNSVKIVSGGAARIIDTCIENFGQLDILVNNATILRRCLIHETPVEDWDAVKRKQKPRNWLQRIFKGFGSNRTSAPNPLFTRLAQGLQRYQATWGSLPQRKITAGPAIKLGSASKGLDALRTRLGLLAGGGYDQKLFPGHYELSARPRDRSRRRDRRQVDNHFA